MGRKACGRQQARKVAAMAATATPGSLGDFFAKKGKNKKAPFKGSNLNVVETKVEEKKKDGKPSKEEEGWEEELVVAPTMKVETVGKLTRDDDKKDEEDTAAPAWGTAKKAASNQQAELNDRKFPTLAKSVQSSSINLEDEPKMNIKTTKNAFAALEDDDEDGGFKRLKEIKPAMVTKQKGESEKAALNRELQKYKKAKKKDEKKDQDSDDEDEEDEDDEEEEEKPEKRKQVFKKKAKVEEEAGPAKPAEPVDDGPKIEPDLVASKRKYEGRKKLPKVDLPRSELEAESRPKPQVSSKKKKFAVEEEEKPKLQVWEED